MNLAGSDKVVIKNNINGSRFVVSSAGTDRQQQGRRECRWEERWTCVQDKERNAKVRGGVELKRIALVRVEGGGGSKKKKIRRKMEKRRRSKEGKIGGR